MPSRKPDTFEFEVSPRIVPAGWEGVLTMRGEYGHTRFIAGASYTFELVSMRWSAASERKNNPIAGTVTANDDFELKIPFKPDIFGGWCLTVDSENEQQPRLQANLGLYVMRAEDYGRRPYIGELHSHSTGSDGLQDPAYCAIRARELGLDFFSLTDHRNYLSSQEMKLVAGNWLGSKMLLLNGEEMHPEKAEIENGLFQYHLYHFVAVGHTESVRDAYLRDRTASKREVDAIINEYGDREIAAGLDVERYAEAVWKIRKAKDLGALVLFCHPYWAWSLNLDEATREQVFCDRDFHAVEVFSGADPSSIMANRYIREGVGGRPFVPVSVSDGHSWGIGTELKNCTYVMAKSLDRDEIISSIIEGRCLAYQNSGTQILVGPEELVDFAEFYFLRILPLKRRITVLEAKTAFSGLRGGAFSRELIGALDDELTALEDRIWV